MARQFGRTLRVLCGALVISAASAQLALAQQLSVAEHAKEVADPRSALESVFYTGPVQQRLVDLGLTPSAWSERLAALSDAEVRQLAERLERVGATQEPGVVDVMVILLVTVLVTVAL